MTHKEFHVLISGTVKYFLTEFCSYDKINDFDMDYPTVWLPWWLRG